MNLNNPDHNFYKAKVRHMCFVLILWLNLALADVPGPCRYSVTKDHLLKLDNLIANQLQNGCSLNYTFTERRTLSNICYVKAALPQILDLLSHFKYDRNSSNFGYVNALKNLILNVYSQKCILEINEEHEDHPVRFAKAYSTSPREALEKVKKVISLYMELMTENNVPVNWNCEEEYAQDYPESTTVTTQTLGPTKQCHCSCPTLRHESSAHVSMLATSPWNDVTKPTFFQSNLPVHSLMPTNPPPETQRVPKRCLFPNPGTDSSSTMEMANSDPPKRTQDVFGFYNAANTAHMLNLNPASSDEEYSSLSTISREATGTTRSFQPEFGFDFSDATQPLDVPPVWHMPTSSTQVTEVFVDGTHSTSDTLGFTESLIQNGISALPDSETLQERELKLHSSTKIRESSAQSTTPMPFNEVPAAVTHDRMNKKTAVMMVKRSVKTRQNQVHSETNSQTRRAPNSVLVSTLSGDMSKKNTVFQNILRHFQQSTSPGSKETTGTASSVLLSLRSTKGTLSKIYRPLRKDVQNLHKHSDTSVPPSVQKSDSMSLKIKDGIVISPGQRQGGSELNTEKNSSSGQSVADSGMDAQKNTSENNTFYKNAFIIALLCGALLLIPLVCHLKKKLRRFFHKTKMTENQRLNACNLEPEMS